MNYRRRGQIVRMMVTAAVGSAMHPASSAATLYSGERRHVNGGSSTAVCRYRIRAEAGEMRAQATLAAVLGIHLGIGIGQ